MGSLIVVEPGVALPGDVNSKVDWSGSRGIGVGKAYHVASNLQHRQSGVRVSGIRGKRCAVDDS